MTEQTMFNQKVRDLDPEIWSLARRAELGELRKIYHTSHSDTTARLIGAILLALGFILTLPSVFLIFIEPTNPSIFLVLPGLLLLVVGGYLFLPRKIYALWQIYLWDSGFLYEKGQLREVFRWDQIANIEGSARYIPQMRETLFAYKVRRQDGYEAKLDNTFQECAQLIDNVLEAFSRQAASRELTLVPPRNKKFTDFKLDRQGISDEQGTLSWQEIQKLTIERGTMAVFKSKDGFSDQE